MIVSQTTKYRNVPTEVDGIRFASKAEARRYSQLAVLVKAGAIRSLELQPRFKLAAEGKPICTYVADFCYLDGATGSLVVEDVKGVETPAFKIKAKLFEAIHGIKITIIKGR